MNTALVLTLIAFIFVAFALLTGKVAPSVACGISIAFLWITGVVDETQVFENFISSNVIVMIGMMIVIAALLKTSILSHIASLVKGNSIRPILIVAMIVPFILCQFIGGVTSMITVLPLLIALASQIGISPTRLVLPASVGAQAGLMALPIGGAAAMYLLKNQMAANVGCLEQLGFWDLFATRMPGTIAAMVFTVIWGYKLLPERELGDSEALNKGPDVFKKSALPKWKEIATYIIFFGSLILMCFSRSIGISNTLIATVAALLCGLLGILNERNVSGSQLASDLHDELHAFHRDCHGEQRRGRFPGQWSFRYLWTEQYDPDCCDRVHFLRDSDAVHGQYRADQHFYTDCHHGLCAEQYQCAADHLRHRCILSGFLQHSAGIAQFTDGI